MQAREIPTLVVQLRGGYRHKRLEKVTSEECGSIASIELAHGLYVRIYN